MKQSEKQKAILLRKRGLSYNEILRVVPVARSTLSLWLREVNLTTRQRQRLSKKRLEASRKGAEKKRNMRIYKTRRIKAHAKAEVRKISEHELWLIGIALYWAEGNKEKAYRPSEGVIFSNSDPWMIALFARWIKKVLRIDGSIIYELYLHKNANIHYETLFWAGKLAIPVESIRVYSKRSQGKKACPDNEYHGMMRIKVRRSTDLNRKIQGWIEGIVHHCGIV